jgi:hypothetical protein
MAYGDYTQSETDVNFNSVQTDTLKNQAEDAEVSITEIKTLRDTTVPSKADKVDSAIEGNLAELDSDGNLVDSETSIDDITSITDSKADKLIIETSEKTADYTLVDGDQNKIVLMNKTGAANLTIPTNASVSFDIGTIIGVYNISSDDVTIAGDSGVTVRNAGNLTQYSEISLRKRDTDE